MAVAKNQFNRATRKIKSSCLFDDFSQIGYPFNRVSPLGKGQELSGQIACSISTDFSLSQKPYGRMFRREFLFCKCQVAVKSGQDIVEVVGYSTSQGTDLFQLLNTLYLFAQVVFFRHIAKNQNNPGNVSLPIANRGRRTGDLGFTAVFSGQDCVI